MSSRKPVSMRRSSFLAAAAVGAALMAGACSSLDTTNPNAPDAQRAFSDPAGLQQLLGGAIRTWVETRGDYFGALPMTMMADSYTASWNNAAIRFYNSVGVECASRCGWNNSSTAPEAAGGPSIESQWYGYYTVLSSANDVLRGINAGICFDTNCATDNKLTSRNKAIAKMLQGMAYAGIAMVYDQGYVADSTEIKTNTGALDFSPRLAVRDSALAKFNQAYTEAGLKTWTTPTEWMGVGSGKVYTNTQIRQLIRTMQAELLAMYPRDMGENTAAGTSNWAQVATYAAAGISSGTPFDFEFYIDASGRECGLDCIKTWGGSSETARVDTRVAAIVTTNHVRPWPENGIGNPCPTVSADKRVGDGSYGPEDDFNGDGTLAATPNAGTDFACMEVAIFPAARGQYHQSNLQHIRYERLAYRGEDLPGSDGTGQDPFYTTQMNDLLWAEGLLRSGGNAVTAAGLINNSRVNRGGLAPLTGAELTPVLLAAVQYEMEIEFMGQGPTPFFNRRRLTDFLQSSRGNGGLNVCPCTMSGTPLQMPVPAKEMDVLRRAIYTYGGTQPIKLMAPGTEGRETVADRWRQFQEAKALANFLRK